MKTSKIAWGLIALVAGLGLGACGGGGGGSTAAGGKNVTVGVVTGFGSVYVNGCEYETDSASISVDGQSATEDDLSVGDVVEVTARPIVPMLMQYQLNMHLQYSKSLVLGC